MPLQPMLHLWHCVFALSVTASVPCHIYFYHKNAERILMKLRDIVTTANRLNNYILSEIGTGTREQDARENSNRCQSVLLLCQTGADAYSE